MRRNRHQIAAGRDPSQTDESRRRFDFDAVLVTDVQLDGIRPAADQISPGAVLPTIAGAGPVVDQTEIVPFDHQLERRQALHDEFVPSVPGRDHAAGPRRPEPSAAVHHATLLVVGFDVADAVGRPAVAVVKVDGMVDPFDRFRVAIPPGPVPIDRLQTASIPGTPAGAVGRRQIRDAAAKLVSGQSGEQNPRRAGA